MSLTVTSEFYGLDSSFLLKVQDRLGSEGQEVGAREEREGACEGARRGPVPPWGGRLRHPSSPPCPARRGKWDYAGHGGLRSGNQKGVTVARCVTWAERPKRGGPPALGSLFILTEVLEPFTRENTRVSC